MSPARTGAPAVIPAFIGGGSSAPAPVPATTATIWPYAGNTGYPAAPGYGGTLADGTGVVIQSNTTYTFTHFPGGLSAGTSSVPVSNVTFTGCLIDASGGVGTAAVLVYGDGITFSYCTIAPTGITSYGPSGGVTLAQSYQYGIVFSGAFSTFAQQLTVDHCDIWGFGNGVIGGGGTQAKPHAYTANYIHDACQDATYHTDGIGLPAGGSESYTKITGNTITSIGNTQGIAYQNSPGPSTWDHFTITGNLLGGWGYTVNVIGGTNASPTAPTNLTFTGNTLTTALLPAFGPVRSTLIATGAGNTWRGNRWLVPPGAQWGHAAYSGYYWLPTSISNASPSLDELAAGLVSTSDFSG